MPDGREQPRVPRRVTNRTRAKAEEVRAVDDGAVAGAEPGADGDVGADASGDADGGADAGADSGGVQ